MHIGLFSMGWPVDEYSSGIVTYVYHLRSMLLNQGHRVSVFANVIGRTNKDFGVHLVVPTLHYRIRQRLAGIVGQGSTNIFSWGQAIAATVNRVNRHDPIDILEMEESFGWCADVQRLITCPVVVKLHGPAFLTLIDENLQTEMAATKIANEGEALRQIAAIISPSQSTLSSTSARYGLRPRVTRTIPNLIDAESGLKLWNLEKCDRKTILFVGRFDKLKGGDTALLAFRRLLDADGGVKLLFVGPDFGLTEPGRTPIFFDEFRNAVFPEALRGSVRYLGQLPRSQVTDVRTKALMTIVVSRWENQGYTAVEAMLQGCPVIVTDVGGMREIIQHGVNGLLVRPNDVDDLCEKMASLLKDPARARELGENGYRFVEKLFSGEMRAAETVDLYREVISMAKAAKK